MSVDIISAPVRVRPKGGQIPKQSVRSRQEGHVWRTWHNINRHYVHDGSRPLMADKFQSKACAAARRVMSGGHGIISIDIMSTTVRVR